MMEKVLVFNSNMGKTSMVLNVESFHCKTIKVILGQQWIDEWKATFDEEKHILKIFYS